MLLKNHNGGREGGMRMVLGMRGTLRKGIGGCPPVECEHR